MDWQKPVFSKRSSVSAGTPYSQGALRQGFTPQQRSQYYNNVQPQLVPGGNDLNGGVLVNGGIQDVVERPSYYFSQYPLYCSDWMHLNSAGMECIALSTYKEGFTNKLQIVHGVGYGNELVQGDMVEHEEHGGSAMDVGTPGRLNQEEKIEGFDFEKVTEVSLDYPITNLQWDPWMNKLENGTGERLAASLEVLRLYKVDYDMLGHGNEYKLTQTHILANNSAISSSISSGTSNSGARDALGGAKHDDINTFPPVTSFDWNKLDPNIIITSSVDTTCTVWDLNRSYKGIEDANGAASDTASLKTQLIAHDSEVFDVKFIHNSSNVFALVGNDGSMRVFDLRSLEHSTIIYEPSLPSAASAVAAATLVLLLLLQHSSRALLKLSTSNIDQHFLATVGANSNQVLIIDMRVPGVPLATLDGSLGGINSAAINSIKWHPSSNHLLTGGDDCQALVWDCSNLNQLVNAKVSTPFMNLNLSCALPQDLASIILTPVLAYEEELEVNNVCWSEPHGDWIGVVSGKGFQAVSV